jgi:2-oxoglutarate dehydrogenase complex dehydrogenase (E1) component-like enzyme
VAFRSPNGVLMTTQATSTALLAADHAPSATARGADALHRLYAGTLAIETAHIDDARLRTSLVEAFETGSELPCAEARRAALGQLIAAEEFDNFLRSNGRPRNALAVRARILSHRFCIA